MADEKNKILNQDLLIKIAKSADIFELNLSVRSTRGLKKAGINKIGELCKKTKLDLLQTELLNINCIEEIQNKLAEIGLSIKPLDFKIATRNDWQRQPVPEMAISFDLKLNLSTERYGILKRGNVPSNMDQWFIYYEKGKLHFYRCTGLCYFIVTLNEVTGLHHVKTYIHDVDNATGWIKHAPEMIKALLERYGCYW